MTRGEIAMPSYEWPLSWVLGRIDAISSATIEDYKNEGEWFRLRPYRMADEQLFRVLEGQWDGIVFLNAAKFALVHCQSGRESGVWLHYLATDGDRSEYLCDCHQIPSW
jgi:hypothetical protein